MIKKYQNYIVLFYLSIIGCLVVAAFRDLQIDISLNNPTDPFSIWFYNTGEMPSRLALPLAGTVLYYLCQKKIGKIAGLVLAIGGSTYLGGHIGDYFFMEENHLAFGLIYGFGFGIVLLMTAKYITIPEKMKKPLIALAIAGVAVVFLQIGIVEGSKFIWGRVRFRDLLAAGSYEQFTQWYHPNGLNGHKSFPSGHTAGAGISYLAMLLPLCSEKAKKHTSACFIIPFIYTSTVAYTRLVMGAHYLSDVTVGATVSFTLVVIALAILEKKNVGKEI